MSTHQKIVGTGIAKTKLLPIDIQKVASLFKLVDFNQDASTGTQILKKFMWAEKLRKTNKENITLKSEIGKFKWEEWKLS